jgi:hypothetical protein
VRGEQGDVGADERLGDVEQALVRDEAHPERVVGDQRVAELLGPQAGFRSRSQATCPRASSTRSASITFRAMA